MNRRRTVQFRFITTSLALVGLFMVMFYPVDAEAQYVLTLPHSGRNGPSGSKLVGANISG